jgi:hypothetical protein
MPKLPPGFAAVLLLLVHASVAASERRSLEPTQEELESFELPRPESEISLSGDGSTWFDVTGVGIFAASAADFATTELGLARGLQEGNPAASQRGIRALHHVVGPAAVYWTTERLQKSGRTKLALGLRIALMAAYSYAAVHNLGQVSGVPTPR